MGGPVGILTGTEQKKPIDATETSHSLFHTEAGGHASSKPAGLQICVALYSIRVEFNCLDGRFCDLILF